MPDRRLAFLAFACAVAAACARAPAPPPVPPEAPRPHPWFAVEWDPATGKGRVGQVTTGGDKYVLCLQCRFPGYTGGLWVGSQDGSGMSWTPKAPIPGFKSLNLVCAQDESLWDLDEGREWAPGWSENFGRGDDGGRLEYVGGEVLDDGRDGRGVLLHSLNAGGCWEVEKVLWWPGDAGYVLVSTAIRNACDTTRRFSLWTGDDPWIGRYRSAEGDVGWHAGGIVRGEAEVPGRDFRWGGMYDLGNREVGRTEGGFSNIADFLMPDPSLPPPDVAYFANRFAHGPDDIHPGRPLDDTQMTAFNLGWKDVALPPGGEARFRYALGRALTGAPGDVPRPPEIPASHWRFDEGVRAAAGLSPATASGGGGRRAHGLRFLGEGVRLVVDPPDLEVQAWYDLQNRGSTAVDTAILYPFPTDPEHPYPHDWDVAGVEARAARDGLRWHVVLAPGETRTVAVRYRQRAGAGLARYILTTTAAWGEPLESGTYEAWWPAWILGAAPSYDVPDRAAGGWRVQSFRRRDFLPPRDLFVEWPWPASPDPG